MENPASWQNFVGKVGKQLTGKWEGTTLHCAVKAWNLELALEIILSIGDLELKELLSKENQRGETPLYLAAECGFVDIVKEMIKYYYIYSAGTKARNGLDAFHIAAKQGHLGVLEILIEAIPELPMAVDRANSMALLTAASQGHVEIVKFLLEKCNNLAIISRSNGKTALHSAARYGHLEVVKALLAKDPSIATRNDEKGQTALHMAVKGQNIELVNELMISKTSLVNMVGAKGNTAMHIATRKGLSPDCSEATK